MHGGVRVWVWTQNRLTRKRLWIWRWQEGKEVVNQKVTITVPTKKKREMIGRKAGNFGTGIGIGLGMSISMGICIGMGMSRTWAWVTWGEND